jgi:hypothetical protein
VIRFAIRQLARGRDALVASAVLALGAGCTGGVYAGPANTDGPPAAYGAPSDGDVVYVQDAPVVDIEAYPSAMYGGDYVYLVEGRWYRRGPRGWAYYRQEPPELGREREERWGRDHDPRWDRGGDQQGQGRPRMGATEAQPLDRAGHPTGQPAAVPKRHEDEETAPPKPKVAPRDKRAPSPPSPSPVEHR